MDKSSNGHAGIMTGLSLPFYASACLPIRGQIESRLLDPVFDTSECRCSIYRVTTFKIRPYSSNSSLFLSIVEEIPSGNNGSDV